MGRTINTILNLQDRMSPRLLRVSDRVSNLDRDTQRATRRIANMANGFASGVNKMVSKSVKLAGVGASIAGAFALKTGFGEAMDMEGFRTQLETATKSAKKAGEIMKWSVNLANSTPFETGSVIEMSSKFEAMGMSAKKWGGITADMAGATNKDIIQATEAIIDAQTGELERLKEFGIKKADISKKAGEMFANQEVINAKGQIVDQEKFNQALMTLMGERYKGGAAALAKTTKGMWSTITGVTKTSLANIVGMQNDGTIKAGSMLDTLKSKVQQVADKLTQWQSDGTLNKIGEKFTKVFTVIYKTISKVFKLIYKYQDVIIFIVTFAVAVSGIIKVLTALTNVIKVFRLIVALTNGTIALCPLMWIVAGIAALIAIMVVAYKKSATFRTFINSLLNKFKEFGTYLATVIPPILKKLGEWFTTSILPVLKKIGSSLLLLWNSVISPFIQWLIQKLAPVFKTIFPIIKQVVMDTFGAIGAVIQGNLQSFKGIIDFITGVFTGNWGLAWQGVIDVFKGIFNGLAGVLKVPLNLAIGLINTAIGKINESIKFDVPKWVPKFGGEHFGINIPQIPTLYKGTDYFKGGTALVGERGPELVTMPSGAKVSTASRTEKMLGKNITIGDIYITAKGVTADEVINEVVPKLKLALANL